MSNKTERYVTEPSTAHAIASRILLLRSQKVLLDADLATLYGVETRALVQAVKRNIERFPKDFMFQLENHDLAILRSQSVISSFHGGRRALPYAFTEQGVAMLASVLTSPRDAALENNSRMVLRFGHKVWGGILVYACHC